MSLVNITDVTAAFSPPPGALAASSVLDIVPSTVTVLTLLTTTLVPVQTVTVTSLSKHSSTTLSLLSTRTHRPKHSSTTSLHPTKTSTRHSSHHSKTSSHHSPTHASKSSSHHTSSHHTSSHHSSSPKKTASKHTTATTHKAHSYGPTNDTKAMGSMDDTDASRRFQAMQNVFIGLLVAALVIILLLSGALIWLCTRRRKMGILPPERVGLRDEEAQSPVGQETPTRSLMTVEDRRRGTIVSRGSSMRAEDGSEGEERPPSYRRSTQ